MINPPDEPLPSELLQAVLDTVGEGIITIDAHSRIMLINQEVLEIWGYSEQELLGEPLTCLMPEGYRQAHLHGMQHYLTTGRARVLGQRLEVAGLRNDGSTFPLELRIQETRMGDRLFFTAAVRDLTTKRERELRLAAQYGVTRILAEAASIQAAAPALLQEVSLALAWDVGVLWEVDRQTNLLRCVEIWQHPETDAQDFVQLTQQTSFARGSGLPGQIWASAAPIWISNIAEQLTLLRAEQAARYNLHAAFGFPIVLGSDVLGVIEFFSHQVRTPDQAILDMIGAIGSQIGQFIERKHAEAQREEMISHLQEALEVRNQFLAQAAHELKTPLTSMLGYAELLERRLALASDDRNQRALRTIRDQAERLTKLVASLLDISRIQSDQLTVEISAVDLQALARKLVDEFQPLLKLHTIHLHGPQTPVMIKGDLLRLEQVLSNLLQNAIKYSPHGGSIELKLEQHAQAACLTVSDSGVGIPAVEQAQLFTRFFRASNTQDMQIGGLGIGLYMVKEIIALHNGTVTLESSEGHGTSVTVCLPLHEEIENRK